MRRLQCLFAARRAQPWGLMHCWRDARSKLAAASTPESDAFWPGYHRLATSSLRCSQGQEAHHLSREATVSSGHLSAVRLNSPDVSFCQHWFCFLLGLKAAEKAGTVFLKAFSSKPFHPLTSLNPYPSRGQVIKVGSRELTCHPGNLVQRQRAHKVTLNWPTLTLSFMTQVQHVADSWAVGRI